MTQDLEPGHEGIKQTPTEASNGYLAKLQKKLKWAEFSYLASVATTTASLLAGAVFLVKGAGSADWVLSAAVMSSAFALGAVQAVRSFFSIKNTQKEINQTKH